MNRLLMCSDFKGELKSLFGLLFLRQHYLQVNDDDQGTEDQDEEVSEEIEEEEEQNDYDNDDYE